MSEPKTLPAKSNQTSSLSSYDTEQLKIIQRTVFPDGSPGEVQLFGIVCTRTGLDPFSKQIYAMKDRRGKVSFITGIDGLRAVASRNPHYAGQEGPFWCGEDGEWKDVWLSNEKPRAAKVGIRLRSPNSETVYTTWAVAHWSEYGDTKNVWATKWRLMLAKCAEALALRKAFPNDLSGLYSDDEMGVEPQPEGAIGQAPPAKETVPRSQQAIDNIIEQAEAPPETKPTPEAEKTPPHKDNFILMLRDKGIDSEDVAANIIKAHASRLFKDKPITDLKSNEIWDLYNDIEQTPDNDLTPF
jgi:phage recombination protein Bet